MLSPMEVRGIGVVGVLFDKNGKRTELFFWCIVYPLGFFFYFFS